MTTAWVVVITVLIVLGGIGGVLALRAAVKEEAEHRERMKDPEFARHWHEVHKNDDWEDSGYFDGR